MKNKRFNALSFLRTMLTLSLVLALTLSMAGCFEVVEDVSYSAEGDISESENQTESENESDTASESASESGTTSESETAAETEQALTFDTFTYDDVPNYAGFYYTEINGNVPFFTEAEIAEANQEYYEYYSPLDELGRCGFAMASVDTALMRPKSAVISTGCIRAAGRRTPAMSARTSSRSRSRAKTRTSRT